MNEFVDYVEEEFKEQVLEAGPNNKTKYKCYCPKCNEYLGEHSKRSHKKIYEHQCEGEVQEERDVLTVMEELLPLLTKMAYNTPESQEIEKLRKHRNELVERVAELEEQLQESYRRNSAIGSLIVETNDNDLITKLMEI